jgi:hypothetical protein
MARPLYVFAHVPKCAGSSVSQFFRATLPAEAVMRVGPAERAFLVAGGPSAREAVARSEFVIGHHLPRRVIELAGSGREIREMVMLRDPVSYFRSLYIFHLTHSRRSERSRAMGFEHWYRCQTPNPIVHFLLTRYLMVPGWRELLMREDDCLRLITQALRRFWFVASYQHCQTLIDRIAEERGLPTAPYRRNVAAEAFDLPQGFAQRILEENRADAALFEAWKDRLWDLSADGERARVPAGRRRLFQMAETVTPRLTRSLMR